MDHTQPSNVVARKVKVAKRRQSDAGAMSDFIELRRAMILCNACAVYRLPGRWMDRFGYTPLSGWSVPGQTCDYCQQRTQCSVYVREEGRLATETARRERALKRAKENDPTVIIV